MAMSFKVVEIWVLCWHLIVKIDLNMGDPKVHKQAANWHDHWATHVAIGFEHSVFEKSASKSQQSRHLPDADLEGDYSVESDG